ncbi:MAG: HEAT repeat domain-containing protein [Elusimicrobiales bacterium]
MKTNGQVLAAAFGTFFALAAAFPPFVCAAGNARKQQQTAGKMAAKSAKPAGNAATAKSAVAEADKPEDPEIEAIISEQLPKIKKARGSDKIQELAKLQINLQLVDGRRGKLPLQKTKKTLSRELIAMYEGITGADDISTGIKEDILDLISKYGDTEYAKPFLMGMLEQTTYQQRAMILRSAAGRALSGKDVYDEVESLAKRGMIDNGWHYFLLMDIDKARALPMINEVVDTTKDKNLFYYAAWRLQDTCRNPQDFKRFIHRVKELGMSVPRLSWVNKDLLAAYIDSSQGEELFLALEFLAKDWTNTSPEAVPMLVRKLKNKDPRIRILIVKILKGMATGASGTVNVADIKDVLKDLQKNDPDAGIRMQAQTSLAAIERMERYFPKEYQRRPLPENTK